MKVGFAILALQMTFVQADLAWMNRNINNIQNHSSQMNVRFSKLLQYKGTRVYSENGILDQYISHPWTDRQLSRVRLIARSFRRRR